MARATETLGVWLGGVRVADLRRRGPIGIVCQYSPEALGRWPRNLPLLSCSLDTFGLLERYGRDVAGALVIGADEPDPAAYDVETYADHAALALAVGNLDKHPLGVDDEPGIVQLAPLYDTVPTRLWPKLRAEAAMRVAGRAAIDEIGAAELVDEARSWSLSASVARGAVRDTAERLIAGLDEGRLDAHGRVAGLVRPRAERIARDCA